MEKYQQSKTQETMKQKRMISIAVLLAISSTMTVWAQGLKDAYKDYFMIGVAVNQRNISNAQQQDLIRREFNSMTAENDMKPEPTEPRAGQFNWKNADRSQLCPPERYQTAWPLSDVAFPDWPLDAGRQSHEGGLLSAYEKTY